MADQDRFNRLVEEEIENEENPDWDEIYTIICHYSNFSKLCDGNWYLIHYACSKQAPLKVVTKLIEQNPDCVKVFIPLFGLPLHIACKKKQSADVISALIELYPDAIAVSNDGYNPIHYMVYARGAINTINLQSYRDIILDMIRKYPDALKMKSSSSDHPGWCPLHFACMLPSSVSSNGNNNWKNIIDEIILALVRAYPDACKEDYYPASGIYPLHIACTANLSYNVMKAIYDAYPQAIYKNFILDLKSVPILRQLEFRFVYDSLFRVWILADGNE